MKYEYNILRMNYPTIDMHQLSDDYGSKGWALNQMYQYNDLWYYIFMREVLENQCTK